MGHQQVLSLTRSLEVAVKLDFVRGFCRQSTLRRSTEDLLLVMFTSAYQRGLPITVEFRRFDDQPLALVELQRLVKARQLIIDEHDIPVYLSFCRTTIKPMSLTLRIVPVFVDFLFTRTNELQMLRYETASMEIEDIAVIPV